MYFKQRRIRVQAFTLIELMVVVGVIAILATLSSVGLIQAKQKARSMACTSNLRQQGIWLAGFMAENDSFPLGNNDRPVRYPNHGDSWSASLRRIGGYSDVIEGGAPGDVFDCPSAIPPANTVANAGFIDYGYNSDGIIGRVGDTSLGLGGTGGEDNAVYAPPVTVSMVVNPSQMIGVGDSFLGWGSEIMEGRNLFIGLRNGIQSREGETEHSLRRHQKRGNYVFCDGHVESLPIKSLYFEAKDSLSRLWTRDNQPHAERFP